MNHPSPPEETVSIEILHEIAQQASVCEKCELHYSRKNAVAGAGNPNAEIMFIGEAPGFHENEKGLPFVGAAGQFLDELLENNGMSRESVFITNVVKCRPPGNRDPQQEELNACNDYLDRQIAAINPLVIVTLGRFSMAKFIPNGKVSEIHGKPQWVRSRLIVPMYHPAAALHQPRWRPELEDDFAQLKDWIETARHEKPHNLSEENPDTAVDANDDEPEQLQLF